jgi:hypothetical protein
VKDIFFLVLLMAALGSAMPSRAQAPEVASSTSEEAGSVIVFAKFQKGTVAIDGIRKAQTELEVRTRCPSGAICAEDEPVKIRFHWVCPATDGVASNFVCREADFDVKLPINGKITLNPEDPQLVGNNFGSVAPCPSGYLIGWVISTTTDRPIKFEGLTGTAVLRDRGGAVESYEAFAIQADANLATRAEIATDIDPRTGTPGLVFDSAVGHYQMVARSVPSNLSYHKLSGPLSTADAFLILLTLDVRLNRPNYPTFVDLDFRTGQGVRASTSWSFRCWTEIQNPNPDKNFTLAGARIGTGIAISGQAIKVPFGGVSDIPGPVTLLGLAPTDESRRTLEPAYIVQRVNSSNPTTVFLPYN